MQPWLTKKENDMWWIMLAVALTLAWGAAFWILWKALNRPWRAAEAIVAKRRLERTVK